MTICIVDTSVVCELLDIPMMASAPDDFRSLLHAKMEAGESLLLPMTSVIETGNHIGQNGDGRQRRASAVRFAGFVEKAVAGQLPFAPTPLPDLEDITSLLHEFPDWAATGSGLGDLSIVKTWKHQCSLNPLRRVYIWSLDEHLSSYDHDP